MDRGAWWATGHGVAKSWTRVTNTFTVFIPSFPFLSGPCKLWKEHFSLYECKQMTSIYIFCLSVRISADCCICGPLWYCSWGTSTCISKTGSSNNHPGFCSHRRLGKISFEQHSRTFVLKAEPASTEVICHRNRYTTLNKQCSKDSVYGNNIMLWL